MESLVIDFAKILGATGGAIFIIWFITQRQLEGTVKVITEQNHNQIEENRKNNERQLQSLNEQYNRLIELQSEATNKNFELLAQILNVVSAQNVYIARIETKVESCPYKKGN